MVTVHKQFNAICNVFLVTLLGAIVLISALAVKEGLTVQNCANDFSPLILALASILSVQVPIIVKMFVNQYQMKSDLAETKGMGYIIDAKTSEQTAILKQGLQGSQNTTAYGSPNTKNPETE